jgi:long-chain acyl-CoA synthetase
MGDMGFWQVAARHPERPALIDADGKRHTAGELLAACNRVANGLRAQGLGPGDTLATVLANETAMVEVVLAAAQIGLYLVPINRNLTAAEIGYIVSDSEAKLVVAGSEAADAVARAREESGWRDVALFSTGSEPGFRSYAELSAGQSSDAPGERKAGVIMNYTSGTTGRPKGVRRPLPPISPDELGGRYAMFLKLFGIPTGEGVHLVVSPLYHTAVLNFCTYHLHNGDAVVLMDKWTPEGMLATIERERVTSSHMVPTHFSRLLALPDAAKQAHDLSSLRHMIHSAAPCPVEVKRRMLEWWGPRIFEYYAASEGGGTLATPEDWSRKPGTVGKAWPYSTIKIYDDSGNECAPGEVGTVYMKMADYKFEYHKDRKKTDAAWKDGLFTVGDAGYLDADGFLFLCDRKSDMIISGGVNIYPAEIEGVLVTHPKVRDVAVFGIPDDDWGEQVKAVVELHSDVVAGPALVEELRGFCGERLARHKIPRTVDFVAALPRDPNGKLFKRKLRDPYWQGRERQI